MAPQSIAQWLLLIFTSFVVSGSGIWSANIDSGLRRIVLPSSEVHGSGAYCNDYTPAHFYIDVDDDAGSNPHRKWVVFLEGGGVCQNTQHCARRYFSPSRRLMTSANSDSREAPNMAWVFPQSIQGQTLLSRDKQVNPVFHNAGRLIIPYCSSDLWLGRSLLNRSLTADHYRKLLTESASPQQLAANLAFRGVAIFRTVFRYAWTYYGLKSASHILLAGSSAGGIGAQNQAEWVRLFLHQHQDRTNVRLSVLADSSWFVDFRGALTIRIQPQWLDEVLRCGALDDGITGMITDSKFPIRTSSQAEAASQNQTKSKTQYLPLNFCGIPEASFPCCLSLACVLTYRRLLQLPHLPTLVLSSRFDAYLPSIAGQQALATIEDRAEQLTQAARLIIEYGAIQMMSVGRQQRTNSFQSTYLPGCMQHVYLATSTLWDRNAVLGSIMAEVYGGTEKGQVFRYM